MGQTIRAAIYTRVSSTGQAENYSLPTQEAACRVYATEQGWEVAGVYTDVHTRTELWERPQLTALREAVRRHKVETVIAYAIDRLSGDPVHLGVILSEADHAGVDVAFVTEPLDDSPEGELIRFVRGYAAKVEHEKIRERIMRGRLARVQSGKPAVGPRPTYGYRWVEEPGKDGKLVKTRLEENPETAWVVRRIFAEIAAGASARQIAMHLTAEGVPTPTGRSAVWGPQTITTILRHPTYTGNLTAWRWKSEKVRGPNGRRVVTSSRPAEEHIVLGADAAPPLVSPELAAAALRRLAINKQEATRNNRDPEAFLLRGGIVRCGYCGTALRTKTSDGRQTYRHHAVSADRHGCPEIGITGAALDSAVWDGIRQRLTNRELIAAELDRLRTQDPTRADTAALERRLAEITRRQRNLMGDLADEDNPDVRALIRADVAASVAEQRRLEQERADLEQQREGWRLAQERLDELDLWIQNVAANLDEFDYAKKRMALHELHVEVTLWATDHTPRAEATMQLGGEPVGVIVTTTSRSSGGDQAGSRPSA